MPPPGDLSPYTGPWTIRQASHLLRRCTFGPNQEMIQQALDAGLTTTVRTLFDNTVPASPPLRYTLDQADPDNPIYPVVADPDVPFGETWVNEPPISSTGDPVLDTQIAVSRINSVYAWSFKNIFDTNLSLMPKLWVFWHNHFVVSEFRIPLQYYQYSNLLEQYAKGNFKALTKAITTDVSMLLYLNGNENVKQAPNENYARELLELFTVGKGDLAGPGDYTTFTEQDVLAMARVLTGWTVNTLVLDDRLESIFIRAFHDTEAKTLSHRFGNAVIQNNGEEEYSDLIDVIFEQEEVSRFISRKFYRYFLNYEITAEIEQSVIEPMAKILRDNDYDIEPALTALLQSEHFYSEEAIGCMIKNPIDYIASATKGLNLKLEGGLSADYFFASVFYLIASEQDMQLFFHPDVAGWKAYYQAPQYYRSWINTYYLPKRNQIATAFAGGGLAPINGGNARIPQLINVINYISTIDNATDPNELIYGIAANMYSYQITEEQKDYLKEILIPGLPDFEWTVEYSDYLANPFDPAKQTAINGKLVDLFTALLEMPEFQLM